VACVGEKRDACRVLVVKHEGMGPLVGKIILNWIDLAENSGGCCANGNEPWSSIK
jgi:hypothetical protein